MGLRTKFNLTFLLLFLISLGLTAGLGWRITRTDAKEDVIHDAGLLAAQAASIRGYTVNEIAPLLASHGQNRFLPESIPAFTATAILRDFTRQFPDYTYREAALNPTNPSNRATQHEAEITGEFSANAALTTIIGTRDSPAGPMLSVSRPLRVENNGCLTCHSTPSAAPAAMVDLYGPSNGFGWKLGEVIGAQTVSVPMYEATRRANERFVCLLVGVTTIFTIVVLVMNVLLHFVVIRPIRAMSEIAIQIRGGDPRASEFPVAGRNEIALLGQSLDHIRRAMTTNLSGEWNDQAAFANFGLPTKTGASDSANWGLEQGASAPSNLA
jgi:hypothetical protein